MYGEMNSMLLHAGIIVMFRQLMLKKLSVSAWTFGIQTEKNRSTLESNIRMNL